MTWIFPSLWGPTSLLSIGYTKLFHRASHFALKTEKMMISETSALQPTSTRCITQKQDHMKVHRLVKTCPEHTLLVRCNVQSGSCWPPFQCSLLSSPQQYAGERPFLVPVDFAEKRDTSATKTSIFSCLECLEDLLEMCTPREDVIEGSQLTTS